jgi:FMN phosphatase YigB (HAD superfamily)
MTIKAVVLDVYDTVLVAAKRPREAYEFILSALGFKFPFEQLHKDRDLLLTRSFSLADYIEHHASDAHNRNKRVAILEEATRITDEHKKAYAPRAEWPEFLAQAKAYDLKLCLGSNLALPYVDHVKEQLPEVSTAVFSCLARVQKPDPKFFIQCAEEMGVLPKETIMIGNSRHSDIDGAMAAGFYDARWISQSDTTHVGYHKISKLIDIFPI